MEGREQGSWPQNQRKKGKERINKARARAKRERRARGAAAQSSCVWGWQACHPNAQPMANGQDGTTTTSELEQGRLGSVPAPHSRFAPCPIRSLPRSVGLASESRAGSVDGTLSSIHALSTSPRLTLAPSLPRSLASSLLSHRYSRVAL